MENEIDWKELWKEPFKVIERIRRNEKTLEVLKTLKYILHKEEKEEKEIKKGGYVLEGKRLKEILEDIKEFDPTLAKQLKNVKTRDEALAIIEPKIKIIEEEIKKVNEKLLEKLIGDEKLTIAKGGDAVIEAMKIISGLKEIYKRQKENVEKNIENEGKILTALENKQITPESVEVYTKLLKEIEKNTRENVELTKKELELLKALEVHKKRMSEAREEFKVETESIEGERKKLEKAKEKKEDAA